jgi:threonine/homoserine/homoserine lactone efflux protein
MEGMMNATTTTSLGAGAAILSVDSISDALHWLALFYQVNPEPSDVQLKAFAVILLATLGTMVAGLWHVVSAIVRRWMRDHKLDVNGHSQPMLNP